MRRRGCQRIEIDGGSTRRGGPFEDAVHRLPEPARVVVARDRLRTVLRDARPWRQTTQRNRRCHRCSIESACCRRHPRLRMRRDTLPPRRPGKRAMRLGGAEHEPLAGTRHRNVETIELLAPPRRELALEDAGKRRRAMRLGVDERAARWMLRLDRPINQHGRCLGVLSFRIAVHHEHDARFEALGAVDRQ